MNRLLRSSKITIRLFAQLAICTVGIAALLAISHYTLHSELMKSKAVATQAIVEAGYSVIEASYEEYQNGLITEEEAKKKALDSINVMRYDGNNYYFISDLTASVVMHPIKPQLNGKDLSDFEDPAGKKLFVEMADIVKAQGEGQVDYMWPAPDSDVPVKKISYVKGFAPWGYIIGSGVYVQDVNATFWGAASTKIIVGLLTMLAVAASSILIARSITSPVNSVVKTLQDIAAGEGDLTQRLPVEGRDEMADLSTAYNDFVEKVHGVIKQTAGTANSVTSAADESKETSKQLRQSVSQQKAQTDNVATEIERMSNKTRDVSQHAVSAADSAKLANNSCQSAKSVVSQGIDSVKSLVVKIDKASSVINSLQGDVGEIVTVLEVIRGIAEQTNLLALNAAIEAARAGEQGRGFAVVADEVRSLASRTQDSTQEIQAMIERLQKGSQEAVSVMETSKVAGEKTVEHSTSAGGSLDDIVQAVSTITGMNTEIVESAEAQSQLVESISHSLETILSESNNAFEACSQNEETATNLHSHAKELTGLIQQFKI